MNNEKEYGARIYKRVGFCVAMLISASSAMALYSLVAVMTAALIFAPTDAVAQTLRESALQAATQEINSGSYEQGVQMMESLLAEYPDFIAAWRGLGTAQRRRQDLESSLRTFSEAVTKNPGDPVLMFQLGIAHGYLDHLDDAFEWLGKAKKTNQVNLTTLDLQPVAAHLNGDERYASLFPTPAEFAAPFKEGTRIIHEWIGENAGDQFSWIARNIGDVDGDGINDIVTSAPTNNENGQSAGKIYVYSGSTGKLLWSKTGLEANGQLGNGVEAAGDVNADGIPDVIAGAPFVSKTYVYSGLDGTVLWSLSGTDPTGGYGNSVKGVGDVNQDGHSDLLIGEPFQIFGSPFNGGSIQHPGRAYVISGADGSTLMTLHGEKDADGFGTAVSGRTVDGVSYLIVGAPGAGSQGKGRTYVYRVGVNEVLSETPVFTADPDETGSNMGGMFLSVVGDVNNDGTPDIYASDFSDTARGPSTGKVYILSGTDGKRLHTLAGFVSGEGYGIGISDAGDVNRDGFDDLVIGAWQHGSGAASGGKVYVHSGKDGSLISTITGIIPGETLGFDTTGMGDVDGDGTVDFLLTSTWSSINGAQSGRMFIVSGAN